MSVRALFSKGKEPRYVFEVLIKTLPEALLQFNQDGIFLKALDPTKTAMFGLTFYATSLEDYMVEEETKVGLIFTTIKEVIKRIGATEKLDLEVDKEKNRFLLYIYPKGGKAAGFVRRFSFPVVSVVEEELPELPTSFEASFEIENSAL
ncbi:MAG: DNA polymerase sliding clamp, partial [Pyrobaculum sp.]